MHGGECKATAAQSSATIGECSATAGESSATTAVSNATRAQSSATRVVSNVTRAQSKLLFAFECVLLRVCKAVCDSFTITGIENLPTPAIGLPTAVLILKPRRRSFVLSTKFLKSISFFMRKLNLGFSRYSDPNLLVKSQAILASMTGNSFFSTPSPSLAILQTAIDEYATALSAAKEGGKTNVATKNAKRTALVQLLVGLGNYVTFTAAGDVVAMVSSGIDLSKEPQPSAPLPTPVIASVEDGVNAGELKVIIYKVAGARTYIYQYTQDPLTESSEWISRNSTLVKLTLSGLQSGKKYWIRVIAYGNNGQEVYSDPVLTRIVQ